MKYDPETETVTMSLEEMQTAFEGIRPSPGGFLAANVAKVQDDMEEILHEVYGE